MSLLLSLFVTCACFISFYSLSASVLYISVVCDQAEVHPVDPPLVTYRGKHSSRTELASLLYDANMAATGSRPYTFSCVCFCQLR